MSAASQEQSTVTQDIFAGITTGIVALPVALAFGKASGLGAEAGLYGTFIIGILASLFGGTPTMISGPTGPMTVFSTSIVTAFALTHGSVENALPTILLTFFIAGLMQIALGFTRTGKYIQYVPYPVISGFMSGVGTIIVLMQIFPILGHDSPKKLLDIIFKIGEPLANIHWPSLILAGLTLAIIYAFPKFTDKIPATLVALVAISALAHYLELDVATIGDIPKGFPKFLGGSFLSFDLITKELIYEALALALLGSIDSLLTSVIADNITKQTHDSDQELMGQGIGNSVAALFGGIPGAGATMRTIVNIRSGGVTRLSGVVHGLFLLFVLLALGPMASSIPIPVLGGILIKVGSGTIDYRSWKHLRDLPRADAITMVIVFLSTIFIDLLQAVTIGFVLSTFLFMGRMGTIVEQESSLSAARDLEEEHWPDEVDIPQEYLDTTVIKHINGPLFFGFATGFKNLAKQIEKKHANRLLLRLENVPYMDQTGLFALEDVLLDLRQHDVEIFVTGMNITIRDRMEAFNIIPEIIPEENVIDNFSDFCQSHFNGESPKAVKSKS